MSEQRRFTRIPFDKPARIVSEADAQLIDISLKGALLSRPAHWHGAPGQPITITLALDDGRASIRMQGRVAHVEPDRVGVVCEHIDMDSITHLRRLVELNTGDPALLQRELSQLGQ